MPAYAEKATTQKFAEMLWDLTDTADRDVSIDDAAENGWLVPEGEQLVVVDHETGNEYLIAVQRIVW